MSELETGALSLVKRYHVAHFERVFVMYLTSLL